MDITGRTVLITGGTAGIGLGLAERLQAAGNTVVVAGRRKALLDEIVETHPGIAAVELDVTDPASIADAVADVTARFPALDVLVNNAGIMLPEDLAAGGDLRVAEDTITTNLLGPVRVLHALLPHLLGRDRATVVNVSSGLAFTPLPMTPTYGATKAAIHSWSESLRVQFSGTGIDVVELVPPAVRTALMGQTDDESAMPLDEFLDEAVALLRQPDVQEVLVDRVKPLRFAEVNGNYPQVLAMLSQH